MIEKMTPSEKARNTHGPHLLYVYVPDELEPFRSAMPDKFPDIIHNHAQYVICMFPPSELQLVGCLMQIN